MKNSVLSIQIRWARAGMPDLKNYRKPKKICSWCLKKSLNQTYQDYLEKGNICSICSSKISNKLLEQKELNFNVRANLIKE